MTTSTPVCPSGFALSVPQLAPTGSGDTGILPGALVGIARYADNAGYEALWTHEIMAGPNLDPMVTLAFLASCTDRARLGVAVLLAALRHPMLLAKECASVDVLSRGRLILGIGIGQPARQDLFAQMGVPFERRLSRTLETIGLLKEFWLSDAVDCSSEFFQFEKARVDVKPIQVGGPPIIWGGRSPSAIRRAGLAGHGWISGGTWPLEEIAAGVSIFKDAAKDRPDYETLMVGRRLVVGVEDTERAALRRMRAACLTQYGNEDFAESIAIYGNPVQVAEKIASIRAMGVNHLVLNPVYQEFDQTRRITEEVLWTFSKGSYDM